MTITLANKNGHVLQTWETEGEGSLTLRPCRRLPTKASLAKVRVLALPTNGVPMRSNRCSRPRQFPRTNPEVSIDKARAILNAEGGIK
jgi:hypothetical protein